MGINFESFENCSLGLNCNYKSTWHSAKSCKSVNSNNFEWKFRELMIDRQWIMVSGRSWSQLWRLEAQLCRENSGQSSLFWPDASAHDVPSQLISSFCPNNWMLRLLMTVDSKIFGLHRMMIKKISNCLLSWWVSNLRTHFNYENKILELVFHNCWNSFPHEMNNVRLRKNPICGLQHFYGFCDLF